jgi:deoxyhypusine synthase
MTYHTDFMDSFNYRHLIRDSGIDDVEQRNEIIERMEEMGFKTNLYYKS